MLEIKAENVFRIRAYRTAAQNIEALTEDVSEIAERGELTKISGIGGDLAGKISEFIKTGKMKFFEKLKKEIPPVYLELITIPGIGPKTAKILIDRLKIKDIRDLEERARAHKLSAIEGIREKTEDNILKGIQVIKKGKERMLLGTALPLAEEIVQRLKRLPQTGQIAVCGSLRRQKETVRDIDILVTSPNPTRIDLPDTFKEGSNPTRIDLPDTFKEGSDPQKIMSGFVKLPFVKRVLAHGPTKSSAIIKEDIQVDVRVVESKSFGAALLYFTGSKEHNIHIRKLAVKKGLKINEYGIFDARTKKRLGGKTEEEIYKILGLKFIPPELREDRGEVESASRNRLPKLIEMRDIKGDFHIHTEASDGSNSIKELVEAAMKRGYEYIAISDHSKTLGVAGGLKERELLKQNRAIGNINKGLKNFKVLSSAEVDILEDGSMDFSDEILSQLDIVTASIHSGFKQSREKLTQRIVRAMRNKHVNIISHITGRLMGEREAYPMDMEEVFKTAIETNTALEINAYPSRLDLDDTNARRAWLESKDILNTFRAEEVLKKLKKD